MNGRPARWRPGRLLPLLLLAAACSEGQGSRDGVVVIDSAGIEIVESSAPAWEAGEVVGRPGRLLRRRS